MDALSIEVPARGPEDPDGSKSAAILTAHITAQHAQVFRQLLWPRLAIVGLVAWALEALRVLPRIGFEFSLGLLGILAVGALVVEWRSHKTLTKLLDSRAGNGC